MGFGKYSDLSVGEILKLQYYSYLRWVYYCNSHIDFFDDILEEMGIINYKIEKPGTDEEMFNYVKKLRNMNVGALKKYIWAQKRKSILKAQDTSVRKARNRFYFNKSILRDQNRGKRK